MKDPIFYRIVRPIINFLFKMLTIVGKVFITKEGRIEFFETI